MLEAIHIRKRPHHLISQDAAEFVLVQKQQPLQTNQLIGLQLEPEREERGELPQASREHKPNRKQLKQAHLVAHVENCRLELECNFHSLAVENSRLLHGRCPSLHHHGDLFDHFGGDALTFGHESQDHFPLPEDYFTADQ